MTPCQDFEEFFRRVRTGGQSATTADSCPTTTGTVFSPALFIFELKRVRGTFALLDLCSAPAVLRRWRESLLSFSNGMPARVRQLVSGHDDSGRPLEAPHLAYLPLAAVGDQRADGRLVGLAAALPAALGEEDRGQLLRLLDCVRQLKLGPLGVWNLSRQAGDGCPENLRPEAWTAHPEGSTHWSTITPVAFDRHPKQRQRSGCLHQEEEMVAAGCAAIGLPRPRAVVLTPVSAHLGVPPAHVFPRLRRKDGGERRQAHAILVFEERVVGPVVIGAGRYRGYGVCRPVNVGAWL
jgi:CRISPR-associated protein Csb2